MTKDDPTYIGKELQLFADCVQWKSYFRSRLAPYIQGNVLEVGAGLGGTTQVLYDDSVRSWVCLESDEALAKQIPDYLGAEKAAKVVIEVGCVVDLPADKLYDTILYIDVLEHIEDDAGEMQQASAHLRPGGHIIVLSPAFNLLYSDFDKAIGHYRRYTKGLLRKAFPSELREERLLYLDSLGMLASLANRIMLRQSYPRKEQLAMWDRWIIPVSKVFDPLILHAVGRSVIGIYQTSA